MADYNSSLPVRTQNNGDVVTFLADATTSSQLASVDSHGSQSSIIKDASGNAITSEANGGLRALDVMTQASGSATGGTAASFSELAGGLYNSTLPTLTTGQQSAIQLDSSGRILIGSIASPLPAGTNLIGAVNLSEVGGSAIALGQTTMSASVPVAIASNQSAIPVSQSGSWTVSATQGTSPWVTSDNSLGSATGGTAGTQSSLAGGIYNSTPPTLTNGQQDALQLDAAGNLNIDLKTPIPAGTNLIGGATVYVGSSPASGTNPVPVSITSAPVGTTVNNYNTAAAVAAGSSSNHIYTITATKTFNGKKVWASASGKLKVEIRVSPDGSTYSTLWVGFNSTANPNITVDLDELVFLESGSGSTVEVIRTNLDLVAFDVYSTISGVEV